MAESVHDPLFRFFKREGQIGRELLSDVLGDLADLSKVFAGNMKQTNHLRSLMSDLNTGR